MNNVVPVYKTNDDHSLKQIDLNLASVVMELVGFLNISMFKVANVLMVRNSL